MSLSSKVNLSLRPGAMMFSGSLPGASGLGGSEYYAYEFGATRGKKSHLSSGKLDFTKDTGTYRPILAA